MKQNQKMGRYDNGIPIPRVYFRKGTGKKSSRCLIKCGDCDSSLKIYFGSVEDVDLEINGVLTTKKEWKRILLPLLKEK